MKRLLDSLFQFVCYYSGLLPLVQLLNPDKVNVVNYHVVGADTHPAYPHFNGMRIPTEIFQRQILFFQQHYGIVSLRTLVQTHHNTQTAHRGIVLTFDDGFRCIRDILPFCESHEIPVTVFVNTKFLDNQRISWLMKLDLLVWQNKEAILMEAIGELLGGPSLNITGDSLRQWFHENYSQELISLLDATFDACGYDEEAVAQEASLYLDWDDLSTFQSDYVEFANHTHSHYNLMCLSPDEVVEEVVTAQRLLAQHGISHPVLGLPFGAYKQHYDETTLRVLKDHCGYGYVAAMDHVLVDGRNIGPLIHRTTGNPRYTRRYELACFAKNWTLRAATDKITHHNPRPPRF